MKKLYRFIVFLFIFIFYLLPAQQILVVEKGGLEPFVLKTFSSPKLEPRTYYLSLSPRGDSIWLKYYKNKKEYLQINDRTYENPEYKITSEPFFAANDESRYIFCYKHKGFEYIQSSWGETFGGYNSISSLAIDFSGKEIAYGAKSDNYYYLILQQEGKRDFPIYLTEFKDDIGNVSFWGLKNHVIYTYMQGMLKYYLKMPNKLFGPYSSIVNLYLSPDGKNYGLIFSEDRRAYKILINDKVVHKEDTFLDELIISPQAKCYAYVKVKDDKCYVINGEKTFGPYEDVVDIFYLNDEKKIGFRYKLNKKEYIHIDGKNFGPNKAISQPQVSPDGKNYAFIYVSRENDINCYLMLNGVNILQHNASLSFCLFNDKLKVGYLLNNKLKIAEIPLNKFK